MDERNVFIVRTHLSDYTLMDLILQLDPHCVIDYPEDVLIISQPIQDSPVIMMIEPPDETEKMNITPLPNLHVLDWAAVDDDLCPMCRATMLPGETGHVNGYCDKCGLSWTHNKVWYELNVIDVRDVAEGQA